MSVAKRVSSASEQKPIICDRGSVAGRDAGFARRLQQRLLPDVQLRKGAAPQAAVVVGGEGVAGHVRKANTPAGVYLIEDDPARPAAVVIKDADSAGGHVDVTLFSVEGGEVKGTIEPTYADGERTEIAIVLSAQAAPAAASPASPD